MRKFPSTIIGADNVRVTGYNLKTFYRLLIALCHDVQWCDGILTSTQAPLHSKIAFIFSRVFKKKVFIIIEQWIRLSNKSLLYRLYESFGYYMMRNCSTLFVHGKNQSDFALSNGVDKNKVRTLPFLSDDLSKLKLVNKNLRKQLSINNQLVILYFGRITRGKGLKDLLHAYTRIESDRPDALLLICGGVDSHFQGYQEDTKYEKECKDLAIKLGCKAIFTGPVNPSEKQDYIAISDIFVHPHTASVNLYDGWGLILNEVASMSLPIISTDRVGSVKDLVINNFNGYIIPAGSIDLMADRLKRLLNDTQKRVNFSKNSREVFERYHQPERIANEINMAMKNGC